MQDTLPSKFRIHVTRRDTILGCTIKARTEAWLHCAVARPLVRYLDKRGIEPIYFRTYNDHVLIDSHKYVAVDRRRMERYTLDNDQGIQQKPTSFTFRRVY